MMLFRTAARSAARAAARPAVRPCSRAMASLPEHTRLLMPALSPTMETGTIASWSKKEGEEVESGDVLAEVETDKATVSFESTESGFLAKIVVEEGTADVAIGELVAILVEEESDVAAFKNFKDGAGDAAPKPAAEEPEPAKQEAAEEKPKQTSPSPSSSSSSGGAAVSPRARAEAKELGVDLSSVSGTGPGGRVLVADVREAAEKPSSSSSSPPAQQQQQPAKQSGPLQVPAGREGQHTDIPHTNVRKVIARRLLQSKQEIPHYYLSMDCRMDTLMELRQQMKEQYSAKVSVNDYVVKACAMALRDVPEVNSSWMDGAIRQYDYVDVSVAVATDGGLITPIVKDADIKSLTRINSDVRDLAERARAGSLQPEEYQGGTFTVSNLGMYGITSFSAIINPPQACILAVGATRKAMHVDADNNVAPASVMTVTASCDHRVVDGAVGAKFLSAFKEYIENPVKMVL